MIEIKERILTNGMKVIACNCSSVPVCVIYTGFHVGSKNEKKGKTGLSHLFEHLMFSGSPNVPEGKFDEILNANGGDSNAYTTNDSTVYLLNIPSSSVELGMWMDSDRFAGFKINPESLKIQKEVVLEERLMTHINQPYGSVEEESSKRLFYKSGYRWPIIGYKEDIESITLEDAEKFHSRFYAPSNGTLVITGDLDTDLTFDLAEKYYGTIIGKNKAGSISYEEMEVQNEIYDLIHDNITLPAKFIFYRIPPSTSKDFFALNILSNILSSGDSSVLQRRFIQELNCTSEVYTAISGMEFESVFSFNCMLNKNIDLELIQSEFDKILNSIRKGELIKKKHIEKAKNKIKTSYLIRLQSVNYIANMLLYYSMFHNDPGKINTIIDEYERISLDDIIDASNKYLVNNKRVVLDYISNNVKTNG